MAKATHVAQVQTPRDPKVLQGVLPTNLSHSQMLADLATDGTFTAATLQTYTGAGDGLDVADLVTAMRKAGDDAVAGKFDRFERVLAHQFLTLDAVFNNLARRSGKQDSYKGIETLLRLAFKAQSQARATAETLALMKNPMPYIKQANIAHGPQQVNNGAHAGAQKTQNTPNELLGEQHVNLVDTRAPAAASRADPAVAAVEPKHGAAKRKR